MAMLEPQESAVETARNYHAKVQTLHGSVADAHAARSRQLRVVHDQLGAAGALGRMDRASLDILLVELGFCCYIGPFAQHNLDPQRLQGCSEGAIRRAVDGTSRDKFGDVRAFRLALDRIERGDGLAELPTQLLQPEGPVAMWSVAAVDSWLASRQMDAAAAACVAKRVDGPCLLSLNEDDIYDKLELAMHEGGRLVELLEELKRRDAGLATVLPAPVETDIEILSRTVVAALCGGEICEVPITYLRRCTQGFADVRVVGEGTFGRVYRAVDPVAGVRFAVKRVKLEGTVHERESAQRSMRRELQVLSNIHHPNMIKLLGYCIVPPSAPGAADFETCLVYEYGSHGIA
jgi:hypothetical protein